MNSIFHRTSIRQYVDKKIEQDKVEVILKAAMAAPSAGNQQPWEFYVVENKEILFKLSQCSPYATCLREAPMAFVACYKEDIKYPEYAQIDLSAAVQNMLLQIDSLNLGGVWLGIAPIEDRMKKVKEILAIDENLQPFAIISCGYPIKVMPQQERYTLDKVHFVK